MRTDKLFIWPVDGIAEGEAEQRFVPLEGYFAVKFGKAHLERALAVWCTKSNWSAKLDGFMLAPENSNWRLAFGETYLNAARFGVPMLLGRRLFIPEYHRLIKARATDKERGIDLSGSVNLNHVEPPIF